MTDSYLPKRKSRTKKTQRVNRPILPPLPQPVPPPSLPADQDDDVIYLGRNAPQPPPATHPLRFISPVFAAKAKKDEENYRESREKIQRLIMYRNMAHADRIKEAIDSDSDIVYPGDENAIVADDDELDDIVYPDDDTPPKFPEDVDDDDDDEIDLSLQKPPPKKPSKFDEDPDSTSIPHSQRLYRHKERIPRSIPKGDPETFFSLKDPDNITSKMIRAQRTETEGKAGTAAMAWVALLNKYAKTDLYEKQKPMGQKTIVIYGPATEFSELVNYQGKDEGGMAVLNNLKQKYRRIIILMNNYLAMSHSKGFDFVKFLLDHVGDKITGKDAVLSHAYVIVVDFSMNTYFLIDSSSWGSVYDDPVFWFIRPDPAKFEERIPGVNQIHPYDTYSMFSGYTKGSDYDQSQYMKSLARKNMPVVQAIVGTMNKMIVPNNYQAQSSRYDGVCQYFAMWNCLWTLYNSTRIPFPPGIPLGDVRSFREWVSDCFARRKIEIPKEFEPYLLMYGGKSFLKKRRND